MVFSSPSDDVRNTAPTPAASSMFYDHAAVGDAGKVCILGLYDVSQDDAAVIDRFSVQK